MNATATKTRKTTPKAIQDGVPSSPIVTPDGPGTGKASTNEYILNALMSLQVSNGKISTDIENIKKSQDKLEAKFDKQEEKLSDLNKKMYAAGVVLTIAVVVGGFFIDKTWDMVAKIIVAGSIQK